MYYIFETELIKTKSVYFALKKIYGINKSKSFKICKNLGFALNLKVNDLSNEQIINIVTYIEQIDLKLNNDLKKFKKFCLNNLIEIKSYRGLRNLQGLPVRGQRTHTNAKTSKKIK